MPYDRREFLTTAAITLGGLAGLANCRSLGAASQNFADFTTKTYEQLIGRFMEHTRASYVANEYGAVATYYASNGAKMKIVDGSPEGLNLGQEAWLTINSWLGSGSIKYDGIPDKVMINDSGVISRYDHNTGVSRLTSASKDLKLITAEVGKYFGMFSAAVMNQDIIYDDPKRYGDRSILAALGRTEITARADQNYQTNFFQVYRDGAKIVEITGCPDLFSESMKDLVTVARIKLGNQKAQQIMEQLDR